MTRDLAADAHAVFLPAFADLELTSVLKNHIARGGCSLLAGEGREEYVAREMSEERQSGETAQHIRDFADTAAAMTEGSLLLAVDQELAGIRRLQHLVPDLPGRAEAHALSDQELRDQCAKTAQAARKIGVNLFLAPIVDRVTGRNVWLDGRTMADDIETISRLAIGFIEGVQSQHVVATAKHFPGFSDISGDPAIDKTAKTTLDRSEILANAAPFRAAIQAGVKAVMVGPAPLPEIDPDQAASCSPVVHDMLRGDFGFGGLIISDDLDSAAVMRDDPLETCVVNALKAGSDLLLVASGPHLPDLVAYVLEAVRKGDLPAERLSEAADRVRVAAKWAS
ncbi:glycoside hydrolase family 3 N-terminal domain-containing protein [Cucumibacter marinus]|uniref:glycoside hydrolase family 3 N-terminal domain-containing protein n=1 Tax=Cucumibacter marinus TaxID=1121252 RepID=UPI000564FC4B|nr:glycoside hydrolase family 3 N-terminal domain-containing protein [Cucumibacter marinus]